MNRLHIGTDHTDFYDDIPVPFLYVGADDVPIPKRRTVTVFDPERDTFNILHALTYLRSVNIAEAIDAAFPAGENTLTKQSSNIALLTALAEKPKTLKDISFKDKKDIGQLAAKQKLDRILLSPVLNRVLNSATNFPLTGTIIAKLDRAEYGDFDCFLLGAFLSAVYKGQIVISDSFYLCPFHVSLIRQNRLIVGVNSLADT